MSGFEIAPVRGVHNHFGPRTSEELVGGRIKTEGAVNELTLFISGENLDDLENSVALRQLAELPSGSLVLEAYVEITEAFVIGGTTPALEVGTSGSEATNGFTISEAVLEAVGTTVLPKTDMQGTWAARLAALTEVDIALSGASPTSTDAGKGSIVVRYVHVTQKT